MPLSDDAPAATPAGEASIEYFLNCPTGVVEHYFASPELHWSDEVYRIHGYERGDIVPTLDLGISHFEPTDRHAARSLWEALLARGGPTSAYLSLRDVNGKVRKVLISGDYILDAKESGSDTIGVWALVVDLTLSVRDDSHRMANEAVAASAVNRAVIEQAKGILMGAAGLTADEAFQRISQYSQHTNRKVIAISQRVIDRAHQLGEHEQQRPRAEVLEDFFRDP
jgi:hypothetical protein